MEQAVMYNSLKDFLPETKRKSSKKEEIEKNFPVLENTLDLSSALISNEEEGGQAIKTVHHPKIIQINRKRKIITIISLTILALILDQKFPMGMMKNLIFYKFEVEKGTFSSELIEITLNSGIIFGAPLSVLLMKKLSPESFYAQCCLTLSCLSLLIALDYVNFFFFAWVFCPLYGLIQGGILVLPFYFIWRFYKPKYKGIICGFFMFFFHLIERIIPKIVIEIGIFGNDLTDPLKIKE